jgi:hypothetical protein
MLTKLNIPTQWVVMNPRMELVKSPDSAVVDVVLNYRQAKTVFDTFFDDQLGKTDKTRSILRECEGPLRDQAPR